MANAKDLLVDPLPRILMVGDSGTHKTYFMAGIPGIYIFDFDKGMAIARGMDVEYDTFKDAPRGSRSMPKQGIYPFGGAWTAFINKLNAIGKLIDEGKWLTEEGLIRPIGIDSLTTMANAAMAFVLNSTGHLGAPQVQHWGAQMNLVETTMDQLNSWPVPLVVSAHIQRDLNDLTQVVEMLPLITGKLAGKLPLYFDEVYYTEIKGKDDKRQYTFRTESDALYKQAKTRWGVPNGCAMDWSLILKHITGTSSTPTS